MEPIESIIIRDLYKSNDWVDLYSIHKKYLLSPIQMLDFCQASSEKGIIEIEGRMARITDFGRIWSIKNRHRIFSSERPWAKGSSYLRKDRRAVEQPYLPKLELLEKDFFLGLLRSEQK
jgi:hypothetical protein